MDSHDIVELRTQWKTTVTEALNDLLERAATYGSFVVEEFEARQMPMTGNSYEARGRFIIHTRAD